MLFLIPDGGVQTRCFKLEISAFISTNFHLTGNTGVISTKPFLDHSVKGIAY